MPTMTNSDLVALLEHINVFGANTTDTIKRVEHALTALKSGELVLLSTRDQLEILVCCDDHLGRNPHRVSIGTQVRHPWLPGRICLSVKQSDATGLLELMRAERNRYEKEDEAPHSELTQPVQEGKGLDASNAETPVSEQKQQAPL